MSRILVIGGAHLDRRGTVAGPVHMHASNPGSWRDQAGGGGFNAACSLSRIGHSVTLIAPRGGDDAGETVAEAARRAGLDDRPLVFLDRTTPTYTAILDGSGDLVVALADMALYERFAPRQLHRRSLRDAISASHAVMTDANLPAATIEALAHRCVEARKPLFAIAISPSKVTRLAAAGPAIACLFMNRREAAALAGQSAMQSRDWPELLRAAGLQCGVISDGSGSVIAFDSSSQWLLHPPTVERVVDVTGAGDTLAAATVSALLGGEPLAEAVRHGLAAAALSVASPDCVPANLSPETIAADLAAVPPAVPLQTWQESLP